jgi:hypothetical protein
VFCVFFGVLFFWVFFVFCFCFWCFFWFLALLEKTTSGIGYQGRGQDPKPANEQGTWPQFLPVIACQVQMHSDDVRQPQINISLYF